MRPHCAITGKKIVKKAMKNEKGSQGCQNQFYSPRLFKGCKAFNEAIGLLFPYLAFLPCLMVNVYVDKQRF